jgi:GDP-mannose 6-dehydrogenase
MENIAVYGLGYVGLVLSACFSKMNHKIIGIDIKEDKVNQVNNGESPIFEPQLDDLIKEGVEKGNISASTDVNEAVRNSDFGFVCVGTPSNEIGDIDLKYIEIVVKEIAEAIKVHQKKNYILAIRSTIFPGTVEEHIKPIFKKILGNFFNLSQIVVNPEFLREGQAIDDFFNPERIIIGAENKENANKIFKLYGDIKGKRIILKTREAEFIKYVENSFHALKVTFANEIGMISKELGIDSHKIMDTLVEDKKLNLSKYYLKPGMAYGGSCLPKDLSTISVRSKRLALHTPLIYSISESNDYQISRLARKIVNFGKKRIGVIGLSFKMDTDDLRESPIIKLILNIMELSYLPLFDKGFDFVLYDNKVTNFETFSIPIFPGNTLTKMNNLKEMIESSDIIILWDKSENILRVLKENIKEDQIMVDLIRGLDEKEIIAEYYGLAW